MAEVIQATTTPGLTFDVLSDGPEQGAPVLLLHGFAESFHTWDAQIAALARVGYRAIAPSQRGYSPGARPDPADTGNYIFDKLVDDPMQIAAQLALERFHLVGHDWGGSIAWGIADQYPERLASLTILSRPHPNAFNRALALPDGEQKRRSRHHREFLEPGAASVVLENDAAWLRVRWDAAGVPKAAQEKHLAVLGNPAAMEAALAWYRARGAIRAPLGVIRVPTLYIWGDADDTVGAPAAEWTREFVSAPYEFAVLPGGGHFTADQMPGEVNALMLAHLRRNPM
ncbi:MAG: alpha/beta hydrolase [Xanthobacteraceae bacterium]